MDEAVTFHQKLFPNTAAHRCFEYDTSRSQVPTHLGGAVHSQKSGRKPEVFASQHWLVVEPLWTPLKHMSSSVGMMIIPNIWIYVYIYIYVHICKHIYIYIYIYIYIFMLQTTNQYRFYMFYIVLWDVEWVSPNYFEDICSMDVLRSSRLCGMCTIRARDPAPLSCFCFTVNALRWRIGCVFVVGELGASAWLADDSMVRLAM